MRASATSAIAALALVLTLAVLAGEAPASAAPAATWLVTESNQLDGNALVLLRVGGDGVPREVQRLATGGTGTGLSLHASGAVTSGGDGRILAVDGRSNTIAVARLSRGLLRLVGSYPSLGATPNSVAVSGSLVYVLNSGVINSGTRISRASIQGFRMAADGSLTPIRTARSLLPESCPEYPCPNASRYSQVGLSPDARQVMVTDMSGNLVLSATVDADGRPGRWHATAVPAPYGFVLDGAGRTIVTNASESMSAVTNGTLVRGVWTAVGAPVPTPIAAACWVVVVGSRAYVAGAPHPPLVPGVSSLEVVRGTATRAIGSGPSPVTDPGTPPLDLAAPPGGSFLYAVDPSGVLAFSLDGGGVATFLTSTAVEVPGGRLVGLAAVEG